MYRVMFVCLGNICRSPMAECIFADLLEKRGLKGAIEVASSATSSEEVGNGIYPPALSKLRQKGVPIAPHVATLLKASDYNKYDLIIGMEERNVSAILRICGSDSEGKVARLLDFTARPRDIADPWWTGDFERAYRDIEEGAEALLDYILQHGLQNGGNLG